MGVWGRVALCIIDATAMCRRCAIACWLYGYTLATITVDPTGAARRPFVVRGGRSTDTVQITGGEPVHRRVLTSFWRSPRDQTIQKLRRVAAGYHLTALEVSGVVHTAGAPAGVHFQLKLDLDEPGRCALLHTCIIHEPCEHVTPIQLNSAAIESVLGPVVGRRRCSRVVGAAACRRRRPAAGVSPAAPGAGETRT
jgi:hypothetical protein